jgi:putative FmdB family regulatory protein
MPLYEYRCESCGHRFERIQKFSDPPLTECPSCGGKVEKLMSSPAIQFKGSGWYITDYAKSGGGSSSKSDSSSSSSPSSAASSAGDTKSAAAPSSPTAPAKVDAK